MPLNIIFIILVFISFVFIKNYAQFFSPSFSAFFSPIRNIFMPKVATILTTIGNLLQNIKDMFVGAINKFFSRNTSRIAAAGEEAARIAAEEVVVFNNDSVVTDMSDFSHLNLDSDSAISTAVAHQASYSRTFTDIKNVLEGILPALSKHEDLKISFAFNSSETNFSDAEVVSFLTYLKDSCRQELLSKVSSVNYNIRNFSNISTLRNRRAGVLEESTNNYQYLMNTQVLMKIASSNGQVLHYVFGKNSLPLRVHSNFHENHLIVPMNRVRSGGQTTMTGVLDKINNQNRKLTPIRPLLLSLGISNFPLLRDTIATDNNYKKDTLNTLLISFKPLLPFAHLPRLQNKNKSSFISLSTRLKNM